MYLLTILYIYAKLRIIVLKGDSMVRHHICLLSIFIVLVAIINGLFNRELLNMRIKVIIRQDTYGGHVVEIVSCGPSQAEVHIQDAFAM